MTIAQYPQVRFRKIDTQDYQVQVKTGRGQPWRAAGRVVRFNEMTAGRCWRAKADKDGASWTRGHLTRSDAAEQIIAQMGVS